MPLGLTQAEQTFDTDIASNTEYTFTGNLQETQAPPAVTGSEILVGDNYTLTGDGSDPALIVSVSGTLTLESLNVANSGAAAAIQDNGAVVIGAINVGTPLAIDDISSAITGSGTIKINAANPSQNGAPVVFGAANTYTGTTTIISGATLQLDANGSINDSSAVFDNGGILDVSGAQTATGAATTLTINNLAGTGDVAGTGKVNLGENYILLEGVSTDFSGVIENSFTSAANGATGNMPTGTNGAIGGGVQVGASGDTVEAHAVLDGAETYTGSTRIFGTLTLGSAGSVEDSSNVSLKANGAALNIESNTYINELTGVAGSTISTGTTTGFTLTVAENATAAIYSGVISGEGGLTVDGVANATAAAAASTTEATTFALTLDGVNTYTGATLIENGGDLGVGAGGTLGTGQLQFDNGTLDITASTGGTQSVGTVAVAGIADDGGANFIDLGANNLVVTNADSAFMNATSDFTGVISGTGSLQVGTSSIANATLMLSGDNTYSGSTVIYGTLEVVGNEASTAGISDSSNVSLKTTTSVLDVSIADETGTFVYTADGGASDDYGSGVAINTLTGVAGSTVYIGDNTLLVNQTTAASYSGVITDLGGLADTTVDDEGASDGVALVVRGSATLTLDGDNTYTGETLVKGSLALGAGGSISDSSVVYVNGSLDVSGASGGTVYLESLAGDNTNATVKLGSNTLDITADNAGDFEVQNHAFDGVISGHGGLTVGNAGAVSSGEAFDEDAYLALSNANTYTGATTIYGDGELEIDQGGSIATKAITDDGTLALFQTSGTLSAVVSGTGSLFVGESYSATTDAEGNGDVTITAADTYSGVTVVFADGYNATLAIGSGGSIANSAVELEAIFGNSTLDISGAGGNVSIQQLSGYSYEGGTAGVLLGANTLIITANNAASTTLPVDEDGNLFEGVISGSGGIQIDTHAALTLEGTETYTGATSVYGTLSLEGDTFLASGSVSLLASNGTYGALDISGADPTNAGHLLPIAINNLAGDVNTNIYLGGNTLQVTETTAATFGGIISDGTTLDAVTGAVGTVGDIGSLIVNGSTALTLTGDNTYTGDTTVHGVLAIGVAAGSSTVGSIADSASLIDDGSFSIGGSTTVQNLTGNGVVKMSTYNLTDTTSVAEVFSGIIHGTGVLDVEGTGALVLTGTSSDYSGGTELGFVGGPATLEVAGLGAAGSGAIAFGNSSALLEITNAALTGGNTATESFANTIDFGTHGGTVDLTNLTFETANSETGNTFSVGTGGVLTITEGNVSVTLHTDLTAGTIITPVSDTHGGTEFHVASLGAPL